MDGSDDFPLEKTGDFKVPASNFQGHSPFFTGKPVSFCCLSDMIFFR